MIERVAAALREPGPFFRWLATQPRRTGAAFGVVFVQVLLSSAVGVFVILSSDVPQAGQLREMVRAASPVLLSVGVLIGVLPSALLVWALVWIPVRIGAGPAERLWEVAGWCQLPQVVVTVLNGAVGATLAVGHPITAVLSLIGVAWSAWFVHAGVRELSGGRAAGATSLYLVFSLVPMAIALVCASQGGGSGSGGVVL